MPCNQIRRTSVTLVNADPNMLLDALEGLGYYFAKAHRKVEMTDQEARVALGSVYDGQTLRLTGSITENQVKQAYSKQVVREVANRYGWRVKETGSNKYTATRRS